MCRGRAGLWENRVRPASVHPLFLSDDVAISASDHSLGLGAMFGPWVAPQKSTCPFEGGLDDDVQSDSETLRISRDMF